MMLTTVAEEAILKWLFENDDATGANELFDAGTNMYVSLHTQYAADNINQSANEVEIPPGGAGGTYVNYARVPMTRGTAKWTVASSNATNDDAATFAAAGTGTTGTATVTHFGIGTDATGVGNLIVSLPIAATGAAFKHAFVDGGGATHTVTCYAHGYVENDPVLCYPLLDASLTGLTPGGPQTNTCYRVGTVAADTFRLYTAAGTPPTGAANITGKGAFLIIKANPITITTGVTPTFAINAINYALH